MPRVPETTISFLDIDCPGALNNSVRVPFAIRTKDSVIVSSPFIFPAEFDQKFILHPNVPNPFNSVTTITYTINESTDLSLKIYNQLGQEVRNIFSNTKINAGHYSKEWDGTDNSGKLLDTGLYICQMNAGGVIRTNNIVLIR